MLRTHHQTGAPFLEVHLSEGHMPMGYAHQGKLIKTAEDLAGQKKFYAGQAWTIYLLNDIDPDTLED